MAEGLGTPRTCAKVSGWLPASASLQQLLENRCLNALMPVMPAQTKLVRKMFSVVNGFEHGVLIVYAPVGSGKTCAAITACSQNRRPFLGVVTCLLLLVNPFHLQIVNVRANVMDTLKDLTCCSTPVTIANKLREVFLQVSNPKSGNKVRSPVMVLDEISVPSAEDQAVLLEIAYRFVDGDGTLVLTTSNMDTFEAVKQLNNNKRVIGYKVTEVEVPIESLLPCCVQSASVRHAPPVVVEKGRITKVGEFYTEQARELKEVWQHLQPKETEDTTETIPTKWLLALLEQRLLQKCEELLDVKVAVVPLDCKTMIIAIAECLFAEENPTQEDWELVKEIIAKFNALKQ